jgi:histidinol-phosphate/aromatic aminotransferase/cobyric acid decarboxylase-like protein
LLDAARDAGVLVISDEAYIEFAGQSAVGRVESQSLIIFRTLSKGFGVPGIRVGCAVASKAIADELRTIQFGTLPWPIAGPSVHAARVCLSRAAVLAERRAEFIQQTARFSRELAAFPDMLVYPSATNFILTRHPRATDIVEDAAGLNVRIALAEAKTADPRAKQLLRSTMRFAIPSPEDMPFVLQAISATLDNTATSVL